MYRLLGHVAHDDRSDSFLAERGGVRLLVTLFDSGASALNRGLAVEAAAQALSSVHHRGLEQVLEVGWCRDRLAVVRAGGGRGSLADALPRLGRREAVLPPAVALWLVLEVLDALESAHAVGVVHGALRSSRVILGDDGGPVVIGFGAAARSASDDVREDVRAVGAMAYELLTLRSVAAEEGNGRARGSGVVPPSRWAPRLHPRLDAVLLRALAPARTQGYRACGELAGALRECLSELGGAPPRGELERLAVHLLPDRGSPGPLPFTEPFALTELRRNEVRADRAPSSSAVPEAQSSEAAKARVRFKADLSGPDGSQEGEGRRRRRGQAAVATPRKTVLTFVRPFLGSLRPPPPSAEALRAQDRREARRAAVLGGLLLLSALGAIPWLWLHGDPEPREALRAALPGALARLLPAPGACYHGPVGGLAARLELVTAGATRLEIDGQVVCDGAKAVGVRPGRHHIRVVDLSSAREYVASVAFRPGGEVRLAPDLGRR